MSQEHVEAVFGPQWVQDSLAFHRAQLRVAERVVVRLRELLREQDPSLPDPYNGKAWGRVENLGADNRDIP